MARVLTACVTVRRNLCVPQHSWIPWCVIMVVAFVMVRPQTGGAFSHQGAEFRRPSNVVLISIDTLRQDELSCNGYPRRTSPAIDALAKRGRIFTNVFATSSTTAPSHMSMFTSQYPFEHGVGYDREGILPGSTYTLADVLKIHGYQTAAFVGNSGPDFWFGPKYGFANGFLQWEFPNLFWSLHPKLRLWLQVRRDRAEPFFLFLHAWDVHNPHLVPSQFDGRRFDPNYRGRVPASWDELFAQGHIPSSGRPLLYDHLLSRPAAEVEAVYTQLDQEWRRQFATAVDAGSHIRAVYDAQLYYADEGIGTVLRWLHELRLEDQTLIIVTSDHGQEFGEHGRMAEHAQLYDELLHVPLIMAGPGVPTGRPVTQLMSNIDLAPTILDLLGIPIPHTARGVSVAARLTGHGSEETRQILYATVYGDVAARTQEWKWIRHPDGRQELYDLRRDGHERENRVEEQAAVASIFSRQFDEMLRIAHPVQNADEAALKEQLRHRGYW